MAPLVRELSEDGVQVNVTALFTTAQVELITAAVADGAPSLHLGLRRPDRRRRRRPGADHGDARSTSWSTRPRAELIWASPREVLNVVQADQVGCHIITMTHDLLAKLELARQGSRPVLARDRPDVPPRRSRRGLHALARDAARSASPAAPGSSAAPSPTGSSADGVEVAIVDDFRTGPARVRRRPAGAPGRDAGRGRRARRGAARRRRSRAATRSSTCRPTPTCATGSSTRSATSSRTRSPRRNVLEAMRAAGVDADRVLLDRLGLRRAGGRSRRPRTRPSRSRRRSTPRRSSRARG